MPKPNYDPVRVLRDPEVRDRRDELELRLYAKTRDPRIREALILRWMPLARSVAWKYVSSTESIDDLVQVATESLIKAIDRYDPSRPNGFSAYGTRVIDGGLKHYFRDATNPIRISRVVHDRAARVRWAETELRAELGHEPIAEEIAERIDATVSEVEEVIVTEATRTPMSLDRPVGSPDEGPNSTLGELIGGEDRGFDSVEVATAVTGARLTRIERRVLQFRFEEGLTQRETGERVGCSQMQVSRLQRRGLEKLLAAVQGSGARVSSAA